jgi:hypothetical protein
LVIGGCADHAIKRSARLAAWAATSGRSTTCLGADAERDHPERP